MFEYLMPLLVMPTYENTLLDQTYRAAVARQIAYGKQRGVAWGISESGYNTVDAALNYQYRAFGVPGLGLKRGLAEDLVIAPYASALALMVAPEAACVNLQRLAGEGLAGKFGFYEAVDYTPSRLPRGQTERRGALVHGAPPGHEPAVAGLPAARPADAAALRVGPAVPGDHAAAAGAHSQGAQRSICTTPSSPTIRAITDGPAKRRCACSTAPTRRYPEVQLLSNGRYHVMVTNAGGGYSRWKDLAVTRWREDTTCDNWGTFCYLRDVASGAFWSTAHQPTLKQRGQLRGDLLARAAPNSAAATSTSTRIPRSSSRRRTTSSCAACASPTARATRRTIEVTSYAEVVLAPPAADALHPAFSNLFVQTEILRAAPGDPVHAPAALARRAGAVDVSPDGGARRGPSRTFPTKPTACASSAAAARVAAPQAMSDAAALSGSAGSVLDPIVAIRYRITLEPEQTATIDMVSGIGDTPRRRPEPGRQIPGPASRGPRLRTGVDAQPGGAAAAQRHRGRRAALRAPGQLGHLRQRRRCAPTPACSCKNRRGQSGLWGYAISGDLPIVLLQIGDPANIDLVRQLVQAHAYWRLKGLAVDLVIWNEDRAGYRQLLQDQIMGLIAAGVEAHVIDRPGGIFVRRGRTDLGRRPHPAPIGRARHHQRPPGHAGGPDQPARLRERRVARRDRSSPRSRPARPRRADGPPRDARPPRRRATCCSTTASAASRPTGANTSSRPRPAQATPAPWVNVLANPHFGTRRFRERRGLHLERERPRIPPHALAQRPGRATRAARPSTCATRKAATSGRRRRCPPRRRALRQPARLRLQRLRAHRRRHRLRAVRSTWPWTPRSSSRC